MLDQNLEHPLGLYAADQRQVGVDAAEAVMLMLEKVNVVR